VITNVLEDAVQRGTGKRASGLGRPTAGKTGTTNDQHDAWFVGYTPQLLATVWVGFDAKRSIGKKETGGRAAAPIWKQFMQQVLDGVPVEAFEQPADVRCSTSIDGARECYKSGTFGSAPPADERGGEEQIQIIPSDSQAQPVAGEEREPNARDFLREDF
jgi:penicillin-binding protein 1A